MQGTITFSSPFIPPPLQGLFLPHDPDIFTPLWGGGEEMVIIYTPAWESISITLTYDWHVLHLYN